MNGRSELTFSGILIIGLIISGLVSLAILGISAVTRSFTPDIENVERLLRQGKLKEASVLINKLPADNYNREIIRGRIYLGFALQRMKKTHWNRYGTDSTDWLKGADADSALAAFFHAQELDPERRAGFFYAGIVCKEKGWYDRAEDELLRAADIDTTDLNTRLALGSLYVLKGEIAMAEQHLKRVVHQYKNSPELLKSLGFLYRFYKHIPESAAVYLSAYLNVADNHDLDIQRAQSELEELLRRYPELESVSAINRKNNARVFVPRY